MSSQYLLITGANTGLGLETVKALLESDATYHIFLGCRSVQKGQDAIAGLKDIVSKSKSQVEPVQIDINDDASIEACHKTIQDKVGHIDILINNAGAQYDAEYAAGKITLRQLWARDWEVNVTSTYAFTEAFAPLLIKSKEPRLLFITSGTSSLEEASQGLPKTTVPPPAGWPKPKAFSFTAYRSAKAGMNMMVLEWVRILKNDNVKIFAVSPGFLNTGLGGSGDKSAMGAIPPSVGAAHVKAVVEGKWDQYHGKAIRDNGIQHW